MKDNVLIYSQQYEAVKELSDADFGKVFRSVFEYAFNGKAEDVSPDIKIAFSFIKNQIDRDQKKYEDKCEANRENVKKRWDTKHMIVYGRIQKGTKHTDTDTDTDIDTDTYIKEKSKKKILSFPERQENFKQSLEPYIEKYGKEMVTNFYDHWGEPNKEQTKMLYEMQDTWCLAGRLRTWKSRQKKW
jgi:hypothetical protein